MSGGTLARPGLPWAIAASLLACAKPPPPPAPWCEDPPPALLDGGPPLAWADVAPIFGARCAGCHRPGGIGPFSLLDPTVASDYAPLIRPAVLDGRMPPWPLAHCCADYQGDFSLPGPELATLVAWIDQGAPLGDAGVAVDAGASPLQGDLPRVDLALGMPAPYLPQPPVGTTDDLRCFVVDWPESATRLITAFDIAPSAPTEIHHARAYLVTASQAQSYAARQGQDGRPGFACPQGVFNVIGVAGAWRPGGHAEIYPPGVGVRVDPGTQIVLQMHYTDENGPVVPDLTTMQFTLASAVTDEAQMLPIYDLSWQSGHMPIPAGDPDVVHAYEEDLTSVSGGKPMTLWSANLHMHLWGSKMYLGVRHPDGGVDCLAENLAWNYHWSGEDFFLAQPVTFPAGDQAFVECHWDNSAAHQPVINGLQGPPHDLNWGNDQEMCIGFVLASW